MFVCVVDVVVVLCFDCVVLGVVCVVLVVVFMFFDGLFYFVVVGDFEV